MGIEVAGIGLLDATYSEMDPIEAFAKEKGQKLENFIFFDAFVDGQSGTTNKISKELQNKYQGKKNYYFYPVPSTDETVLTQHLRILKSPGLKKFFILLK